MADEPIQGDTIVINDVTVFDSENVENDVVVNIRIQDGKLEIVTKDPIPGEDDVTRVNAAKGVLIGQLHAGDPPSFLIMDTDPREDFAIMLDTANHAVFAVHKGQIVRNNLLPAIEPEPKEWSKGRGWLAYTPPPLALPVGYTENTKFNKFETKYINGLFVAAVVLDRMIWTGQDDGSRSQVGDLGEFEGGEIRGLRFGLLGTLNFEKPWVYTFAAATNAFDKGYDTDTSEDIAVFDYRLDIPIFPATTLSIGKQKEPMSMERLANMIYLPFSERTSVSDALMPSRNVGVVVNGMALGRRMSWAAGAFNDWLDTGDSFSDGANQFVGRVTGLPFISEDEGSLVHLGFGMRYTDAREGLRFLTEPEFNKSPVFVDTGRFEANNALTYDLELSLRKGPFWFGSEFVRTNVDAPARGNPTFGGYHLSASWILTGEMRPYNRTNGLLGRIPIAKPTSSGGWGAWELGVRWSEIDLTDQAIDGGEMDVLSFALGWWLTPKLSLNTNYRLIELDRDGVTGRSQGFTVRAIMLLE
jgi:phosphate-selective porin OprO/OprP